MKNFICVVVLALAATVSAFAASEPKDTSNRDENGKFVRGPYLTNKIFDNCFVGAAWGMNLFSNKKNEVSARVTPTALDIYFGKWFCPQLGLRINYTGLTGSENSTGTAETEQPDDKLLEKFGFVYIHGDVLWNPFNTFGGFREDRLWTLVPYVHAGYLRLYDVKDDANKYTDFRRDTNKEDNEIAGGFGLLNLIHVAKRWNLTLDVRNMMFSARFHNWDHGGVQSGLTATLGVQYLIGKTTFDRDNGNGADAAALAAAEAALLAAQAANKDKDDDLDRLRALCDSLAKDNERLRNTPPTIIENTDTIYVGYALGIAPIYLYFAKNESDLSVTEKMHLKYYVETVIEKDPNRVFYLTGSADKSTGNDKINSRISRERVDKTIEYLKSEYGIDESRLQFRAARISDDNEDARLDRCVLIEH